MKAIVFLWILFISSCVSNHTSTNSKTSRTGPEASATNNNPFGVLISANQTKKADIRIKILKALNVKNVRANIIISSWEGENAFVDKLQREGFNIILNVNYAEPGEPALFPTDLQQYKNKLTDVLSKYKPALIVIENEELNQNYHTGSAEEYIKELSAAIEVAHAKGLKVTNGGITSRPLTLIAWNDYMNRGMLREADNFAKRTMPPDIYNDLPDLQRHPKLIRDLEMGTKLLNAYKSLSLDYINFHWYEPIKQRTSVNKRVRMDTTFLDTRALEEVVSFLRNKTGKNVITNEIGQLYSSPEITNAIMEKLMELELPYVIWYSGDGGEGKAIGLNNADGTLRPNGEQFKDFIKKKY